MARAPGLLAAAIVVACITLGPGVTSASATLAPLRASNYAVRSVCAAPAQGTARCLALQLVPTTAAARARANPIGMTRRRTAIEAGSAAEGAYGLRPQDLHSAYALPTEPTAGSSPQTIAIVDAFNDPTAESDLKTYDEEFHLPACTKANGCLAKLNQEGKTSPLPLTNGGWALEISLDIETAHAVCQSCQIKLFEASSNSYEALEAAERRAVEGGATEVSNSWGGPEPSSDSEAFNHPGVVITAAAGDEGYLNWDASSIEEVGFADYPAASPHVVAVGGTHLRVEEGAWKEETVWNEANKGAGAGGGGCSKVFTAQPWQQAVADWSSVGCGTHRAVTDVSADADPYSGVAIYDSTPYEGSTGWFTVGGTSLASPIIASTFALASGSGGVSYPAQTLYYHMGSSSLHDVVSGSNGGCSNVNRKTRVSNCTLAEEEAYCSHELICNAAVGYDGPTGVGTPDGIGGFSQRPPTVVTTAATSITQTSASLNATVNANGGAVSDCHIEYGTTTSYGSSATCTPSPGSGTSPVAVSAAVTGLTANTTYHFRISATNAGGTERGSDQTFFTTAPGAPHYYSDRSLVKAEARAVIGWGTLELKGETGAAAGGVITCHYVTGGNVSNPEGGGAGQGATQALAVFDCESNLCKEGVTASVVPEKLPWLGTLTEGGTERIPFRSRTAGIKMDVTCGGVSAAHFKGEYAPLAPAGEDKGTSAAHPGFLSFGAGSGELEEEEAPGTSKTNGGLKVLGYEGQELIQVK